MVKVNFWQDDLLRSAGDQRALIILPPYVSDHIGAPLVLSTEVYSSGLLYFSFDAGPSAPGAALCPFPDPVLFGQSLAT